jgi:PadR family transcriptional regulator PadR
MTDSKFDFEDLTYDIMYEGDSSVAALKRWQERYPQYRDRLEQFFNEWATQKLLADLPDDDELPEIDEERLVREGVEFAMEILRSQGRLLPETPAELPQPFDQFVLTAIYLLHGKADAVAIAQRVGEMSNREVFVGSMYVTLGRLENQGLVRGVEADPACEPDGKPRRYFTVTLAGERVLALAKQRSTAVADFLGDFA